MLLLLLLVSLFAVGCGDSGEDFVVVGDNGNNNPQVPTTTVNFQFARAQANVTANVPTGTTRLHIEFLSSLDAKVFETEVDFAPTVSVGGVPVTATKAVVTPLDRNGIPLATILYNLQLVEGKTFDAIPLGPGFLVTFNTLTATPDPTKIGVNATQQLSLTVGFSNGNTLSGTAAGGVASYTSGDALIASVSSSGLITGVSAGNTTVNVSYSLNNVTRTDTVSVEVTGSGGTGNVSVNRLIANPTSVTLTNSTTSQKVAATFFPANSNVGQNVTATGVLSNFTGGVDATNLSYTSASGNVTSTAAVNGTATLTLSFTPQGGSAVNTTVPITVSRAAATGGGGGGGGGGGTPARLQVLQSSLFVQSGATSANPLTAFYFPANSTTGVLVPASALVGVAKNANPAGTENRWTFNNNATISAFGAGGSAADNNTVVFTITHTPANGAAASVDITITAVPAMDPRLSSIISSTYFGATNLTLPSGAGYPFTVVNVLGDGSRVPAPVGTTNPGEISIDPTSANNIGTYGTLNGHNGLTAAAVAATGTVTLRRVVSTGNFATVASINVTIKAVTLGAGANVVLTPAANSVKGGNTLDYKVEWVLSDATRVDVTPFYSVAGVNLTPQFDPVTGLSLGHATTTTVMANTAGTLTLTGVIGGLVEPAPGGTLGPVVNINVTP